ncbi:hypothetical protein BBJ28_00019897 [Nothophytophthora sp. Chile5]|nr:hypothetical protein BBJ28_00019897 [Nothophytophthora sp. Chile5]
MRSREGLLLLLSAATGWRGFVGANMTALTCSSSAVATWVATCPVRTANSTSYVAPTGMTASEINVDESNAIAAYNTARLSALKLSAAAGNAAMAGLRKKSTTWYQQSLASLTTYLCVESSSAEELERCVSTSSDAAVRDINGACVAMLDADSCSSKGLCERKSNCKWDDVVANGTEARRQLFTDASVTTAKKWMSTGYPTSLAPFVAPGIVMGVLTAFAAVSYVVLRCVFNRCGGRDPNEKGYSRCDILIPTVAFLVCSLAVFICMVITAALNANISDGFDGVLYSLRATLENADIFVANLLVPLEGAVTGLSAASAAVSEQFKSSDWIASDGATLKQMIADFGAIYINQGTFPSGGCDPKTSTSFCMACPDAVCGAPITSFMDSSSTVMAASSGVANETVLILQSALVDGKDALSTTLRTAALSISGMGSMINTSKDVVDVIDSTYNEYSFSRTALVVCVFLFGLLSSILGIVAIVKNACTSKTTKWVHLLHVSWALGVLVCVLSFVLSASLLAVGAVWYDSCTYMQLLHEDMSPYAATQMAAMADACFNGSNILTPLGLDSSLAFSCATEDDYAALQAADMKSMATLISQYGEKVSSYDLTDFNFNSTRSRSLVAALSTAVSAAGKPANVSFTQENVMTPWVAYKDVSTSYGCDDQALSSEELPTCYMKGLCTSDAAATTAIQTACQTAFANAYTYGLAFLQVRTMLDEMREALLGDTGTSFSSRWNYTVSINEFATAYFAKLGALQTGPMATLLGANGAVRSLLTTVETTRCSSDCAWANLSFDAVHDTLCSDILGTTMAISLCAFFLSLFLLPLIAAAAALQKRLRGAAKGSYDQLERRLQELERRTKQQKQETEGLAPRGDGERQPRGGMIGSLFKGGKKVASP